MDFYNLLTTRNRKQKQAELLINTAFIEEGGFIKSINYKNELLYQDVLKAAIVDSHTLDKTYVYTIRNLPLSIGSYALYCNSYYLIVEEYDFIKPIDYHKYKSYSCNAEVNKDDLIIKGRLITNFTTINQEKTENELLISSSQHPMFVCPSNLFKVKDRIELNGQSWQIIDINRNNVFIDYCSLSLMPNLKDNIATHQNENYNYQTQQYEQPTEEYYFTSNIKLNIIKKEINKVIYEVPFGINKWTIFYKENGIIKQKENTKNG